MVLHTCVCIVLVAQLTHHLVKGKAQTVRVAHSSRVERELGEGHMEP